MAGYLIARSELSSPSAMLANYHNQNRRVDPNTKWSDFFNLTWIQDRSSVLDSDARGGEAMQDISGQNWTIVLQSKITGWCSFSIWTTWGYVSSPGWQKFVIRIPMDYWFTIYQRRGHFASRSRGAMNNLPTVEGVPTSQKVVPLDTAKEHEGMMPPLITMPIHGGWPYVQMTAPTHTSSLKSTSENLSNMVSCHFDLSIIFTPFKCKIGWTKRNRLPFSWSNEGTSRVLRVTK